MKKLNVALLEDNKYLLKDLKDELELTGLVNVIVWAGNSKELFDKLKTNNQIDALILDIDIGDSMNGIDIAFKLQLPVLFVSGKTKDYFEKIEELNLNSEKIVEHISKPVNPDKMQRILAKFKRQIEASNAEKYILLDLKDIETNETIKRNKILLEDIVFIGTDKNLGSESNNKIIYFINRDPAILIDFSFTKMEEKGFSSQEFLKTHKSYRVNAKYIKEYNPNHTVTVKYYENRELKEYKVPVSENYRYKFKKNS